MSRTSSTFVSLLKLVCLLAVFTALFGAGGYLAVRWALSAEEFQVPDVVGLPLGEAELLLAQQGLEVELDEAPLADAEIPSGRVLRQNPPAGTAIKRQRTIRLTLSSGLPERVVVDTRGDVFTRAQIALQQQEVGVDYIARVHSYEADEDRVIAQQPDAAEVEPGASAPVRLLVSLGPPQQVYVMPDLIGQPLARARGFLEAHAMRLAPVQERRDSSVPPGTVVHQIPAQGFRVEAGAVIVLWVSS